MLRVVALTLVAKMRDFQLWLNWYMTSFFAVLVEASQSMNKVLCALDTALSVLVFTS
jgi:hypothetical protein